MCGIVGVWNERETPSQTDIDQMNDCLAYRGPDAEGTFVEGPVGLGHRRLSIIDPGSGSQPLFNEDGDVAVVFNGEIYNYRPLRADLKASGHRFRTDTDTEVLVHLYEEQGVEFVKALDGMFAFALYDRGSNRLLLARDQYGIKPLVLAEHRDEFAFASELPALFESPVSVGGINDRAIATYFGLGYIPSPLTAFENAHKLRPGERVVIDRTGKTRDCFDRPTIEVRNAPIGTTASELRGHIESALEKRLMSDVPLGAFLSGGIDSSIIVAQLSELLKEPIKTFTVGFEESRFDESWAGKRVAEHFGTDHTEFTCSPETVRQLIPDVLSRLGEPFADPSLLPTYVVAKETSDEVTVALSGDGGDELFAGYDKYRGEYMSRYYRLVPEGVRRGFIEPVIDRLPASRGSVLGEAGRKLAKFTEGGEPNLVSRHFAWLRIADNDSLRGVETNITPQQASEESLQEAAGTVRRSLPQARQNPLEMVQAIDTRHSLPDQLLAKVDRASMYNSLEVRVPFLDPAVVEYAFSLPRSHVMTARSRKRILKRAYESELPAEILSRSKQGFDMPISEWFKGPLADDFEKVLANQRSELLDTSAIRTAYDDHYAGRREYGKFLWAVYVFGYWHRWLRNRGIL